jgi:hypothetical protein
VYIALVSFLLGTQGDFDFLSAESRRSDRDRLRVRGREKGRRLKRMRKGGDEAYSHHPLREGVAVVQECP